MQTKITYTLRYTILTILTLLLIVGCVPDKRDNAIETDDTYSLVMSENNEIQLELSPELFLVTAVESPAPQGATPQNGSVDEDIKITKKPDSGSLYISNYLAKYTPNPRFIGTDTFTIETGTEDFGDINIYTVTVEVTKNTNLPSLPIRLLGNPTTQIKINEQYRFVLKVSNPEELSEKPHFTGTNIPDWISLEEIENGIVLQGKAPSHPFIYNEITLTAISGQNVAQLEPFSIRVYDDTPPESPSIDDNSTNG